MAIAGGADVIQFREKHGSARDMIETACRMKELCERAGVMFIVNDRVDVALASNADGVHLGQEDFPIPLARRLLGNERIIGGSAGNMEEAKKCIDEGADYIGFGPIFSTQSKDDAGPATGIATLRRLTGEIHCPVIAIGGINEKQIPGLIEAGAHGVAVISAVCCAEDPEKAARSLKGVLNNASKIG